MEAIGWDAPQTSKLSTTSIVSTPCRRPAKSGSSSGMTQNPLNESSNDAATPAALAEDTLLPMRGFGMGGGWLFTPTKSDVGGL